MILNAVAVTFMLTLDDEIIGASDYERISRWDGNDKTICKAADTFWAKLGQLLLKIHPLWQRRFAVKNCVFECCDIVLIVPMIIIPFIVLWCYPEGDSLCLYEGYTHLCI